MTTVMGIIQIYPFCKYGDVVYCSYWYKLPISQQKYFIMIIQFSQIERKFSGYGLIDCNFEMYMKV